MGFKEIAAATGLTLATLPLLGCDAQKPPSTSIPIPKPVYRVVPETPTSLRIITPTIEGSLGRDYEDVRTIYPEIEAFRVKSDVILTGSSRIAIYNFSTAELNLDSIRSLYVTLESMASLDGSQFTSYIIGGKPTRFNRFLRPANRLLFIVPEDAPNAGFEEVPNLGEPQTEKGRLIAYTKRFKNRDISIITIVPLSRTSTTRNTLYTDDPPFRNMEASINTFFATEACQAAIDIQSDSDEHSILGQEIYCNSVGRAAGTNVTEVDDNKYHQSLRAQFLNINGVLYESIAFDRSRFPLQPYIRLRS